jgi:hypothetical protein
VTVTRRWRVATQACSSYSGKTTTSACATASSNDGGGAHAEVVVFPEYDEQACVATLHLRVTVTNRGTAPVFIREQFLLDSDGYVARTIHPLMDGLAQRTEERVFTVAGVEIAPGASATRSIVVDTLRKADRYTLGYERYEDRKFTLVAVPLDVSAAIARALAAPSRAIGPPPAATPTPNIQLTYDPPIAGPGAVIKVRGSGFTVPPLLRGNGPDGAAELDLVIEVVGNTPPRLSELPRSITANPDGTFVYDLSANTLGPGQYAIVVTYYGPGVETYRGPVLTITAP